MYCNWLGDCSSDLMALALHLLLGSCTEMPRVKFVNFLNEINFSSYSTLEISSACHSIFYVLTKQFLFFLIKSVEWYSRFC